MLGVITIISGGQTGADRAALDFAITHNIKHAGYCPKGRWAEDGVIDAKYNLEALPSTNLDDRTKKDIEISDGTLIFVPKEIKDGTRLTIDYAKTQNKPCLLIDLSKEADTKKIRAWVLKNKIKTLNIAGPRASNYEGVYDYVYKTLAETFIADSCDFSTAQLGVNITYQCERHAKL